MDSEFRELSTREKELLERLLDAAIHGRNELRTQLNDVKAKQIEDDGTLLLECPGERERQANMHLLLKGSARTPTVQILL